MATILSAIHIPQSKRRYKQKRLVLPLIKTLSSIVKHCTTAVEHYTVAHATNEPIGSTDGHCTADEHTTL